MTKSIKWTRLWSVVAVMVMAAVLLCGQAAFAADRIHAVRVEGSQRIEPATVMSYIDVQAGDEFNPEVMNRALKNLFATGLFADVSLYQENMDLVIVVVENPIINEIRFEGNDKVKKDALTAEIQLRPRSVLTRTKVQADVERLQDLYRLSGRFSATIDPKIIKLDQNRVNLVFEISEGPETTISRISFLGNKHYDDETLQKIVRSKEDRWWRFFSDDDKYDPDRLDYDKELMRKFYLDHGYADFNVESAIAELSPDSKNFYVTFTLDEGERYKVGTTKVVSNIAGLDPEALKGIITLKKGDWYKASEIENSVNKMTDEIIAHHNVAFVDVVPTVDRQRNEHTVDITLTINPGKKVYVNNINVSGNVRTLDEVIRREMTLSEGDPFNMAKMKDSEKRIKDLGYFEDVQVKPVAGSSPDKTDIDVSLSEKSTGSLSVGGGFSTTDGALADFQLKEKNFLGRGQDVSFATTLAQRRTDFDFSFTEPYFLKRDLSAGFDIFHTTVDYQDESSYDSKKTGAGLRLGYPLSDHWRQNLNYRYEEDGISNVPTDASIYIQQQVGTYSTSAVSQRLTYDTTDSKQDPTEGLLARFDTEYAGIGGDAEYGKVKLGGTYYYPVYDKWVLSLLGEGGYIKGLGGKTIRINERFYVGGDTLRGFEEAGIGPRDSATEDALGGNEFYRGSVQIEFPSGLPEDLGVRLHTFSDFGSLTHVDATGPGIEDDPSLRASVGFGVSWKSPLGPVTADFAEPVIKENFDHDQVFRFSFGARF